MVTRPSETEEKDYSEEPEVVPVKGYVLLSPVSQYKLYGKFPWAFMVHMLIIFCDSWWLIRQISTVGNLTTSQELIWFKEFLDKDFEVNDQYPSLDRTRDFYQPSEIRDLI